ncbi:MAG: glucose 1-dehydrogenase [Myxococcota bacterium]
MGRLDNKVVLMTGGAAGLGEAGARVMAAEGGAVVVTDVNEDGAMRVAAQIREAGGKAIGVRQDTTSEQDWRAALDLAKSKFGAVTCIVNNAGIEIVKTIEDTTTEDLERLSKINEWGVFYGVRFGFEEMKETGGSIINISSIAGLRGFHGLGAYCMSKGGVRLLTKAAALEASGLDYPIRVNSIHPGVIRTAMGNRLLQRTVDLGAVESYEASEEFWTAQHPSKRLGQPTDIANAMVFLASDESDFVNGSEIVVDGGYTAR